MKKLKFIYNDNFCSTPTENGCFMTLISDVITQKHRDMNRRLQKKHSFIIVQRSSEHRKLVRPNKRMPADNLSYFGLLKNVEVKVKDDVMKKDVIEKLNLTIPNSIAFNRNSFGEIHFSLLENIIFPKGSLSKANKIIAKWIGELANEVPLSPQGGNIETYDSTNHCMQSIEIWNEEANLDNDNNKNKNKRETCHQNVAENKKKRKKMKLVSRSNGLSQTKKNCDSKEDDDSDYLPENNKNNNNKKQIQKKERDLMLAMETHEQSLALDKKEIENEKHNKKRIDAGASIQKTVSKFVFQNYFCI